MNNQNLGNIDFSNTSDHFLLTRIHLVMNKLQLGCNNLGLKPGKGLIQ
jgi:hypothetical protein